VEAGLDLYIAFQIIGMYFSSLVCWGFFRTGKFQPVKDLGVVTLH